MHKDWRPYPIDESRTQVTETATINVCRTDVAGESSYQAVERAAKVTANPESNVTRTHRYDN